MTDLPISFTEAYARKLHAGEMTQARRPRGLLDQLKPGDRLWVREPFHLPARFDHVAPTQALIAPGIEIAWTATDAPQPPWAGRQRFAREMPKALHRAHLIVRSLRQERLQDLSDDDAVACGFINRMIFQRHWDHMLKGGKFSVSGTAIRWQDNPAVNVIVFDVVPGTLPA
ncbi:MAG TPA: hypothetical protein VF409_05365 [Sphingomonas sp.]